MGQPWQEMEKWYEDMERYGEQTAKELTKRHRACYDNMEPHSDRRDRCARVKHNRAEEDSTTNPNQDTPLMLS